MKIYSKNIYKMCASRVTVIYLIDFCIRYLLSYARLAEMEEKVTWAKRPQKIDKNKGV